MVATLQLHHVFKYYDKTRAVQDFSLDIPDGSFTVLVGPSGCGKTTVLRLVAGLEHADQGYIKINDRIVNDLEPKDRDIAMVFQSYALYPHMTVFDNMAFGLKIQKQSKKDIRRCIQDAAAMLGIEDKLTQKPKTLSGGQRQRVALGRAIVRNPKVFLFDEPLSNLDAKLRVQMRMELERLHRKLNTTTLYVTHDQVEAMTLGDRMAVIQNGMLHQADTPRAIYHHPVNMFVAEFIGSPAMNFIPARIETHGDCIRVAAEGLSLKRSRDRLPELPEDVIIGIRPEHLSGPVSSTEDGLRLQVSVTENLGHTLLVHGRCGDAPVKAVMPPDTAVQSDDTVQLSIMPDNVYFFDPENQKNLCP